jgi:AraC family transcriptional regulator
MEFAIEECAPLRLLGVRRTGTYRHTAPAAFEALVSIARAHGLMRSGPQFFGLSYDSPDYCEASELRFDACISSDAQPVDELRRIDFGGGTYAVYRHQGPYEFIEHVFDRLFDAVVFSGRYELRDAPCLERYLNNPEVTKPEELLTDVCIPVA